MATKTPKVLGREALGRGHFKRLEVEVPEWEGVVLLRRITERDLTEIQSVARKIATSVKNPQSPQRNGGDPGTEDTTVYQSRFRRMLVQRCWINEDGSRVLPDVNDLELLADEEFAVINFLAEEAAKHNGLAKQAVEDAEKNSDAIPNDVSGFA